MKNRVIIIALFIVSSIYVQSQTNENIFSMKLGNSKFFLLSEGQRSGSTKLLIGAKPEIIAKYAPNDSFPMAANAFLWQVDGKNILFDTGYGKEMVKNLQSLGLKPEDIDAIFISHMHGDHIGGLIRKGQATFPNAELYLPQAAYDYWKNEELMNQMPENLREEFLFSQKIMEVYKDHLHLFQPNAIGGPYDQSVFPGIKAIAAPGHTSGHTVYLIESGNERLLYWGDLVHSITIQMPFPDIAVSYDDNPRMATQSRLFLLQFVSQGIFVSGAHIPYPGIGTVEKLDTGYKFIPAK